MKAAVYYETGAPDVFRYEDVPDPPLHPNGVLIDVKAIAIEGGDVLNRAGGAMTSKPHIVGYNCAGVVREVGAEVTDRKPGDRVTALMANGSHAAVVSVPATSTFLVPDGCSIEHAACVPVSWGTAHDCLFEFGRLKAGETVLVQAGTSGVGIACVQLAKRAGATRHRHVVERRQARAAEAVRHGHRRQLPRAATSSTPCATRRTARASTSSSTPSAARRWRAASSASPTAAASSPSATSAARAGRSTSAALSRQQRLDHGRLLRPGDVPQRRPRRADDGPAARATSRRAS